MKLSVFCEQTLNKLCLQTKLNVELISETFLIISTKRADKRHVSNWVKSCVEPHSLEVLTKLKEESVVSDDVITLLLKLIVECVKLMRS